MNREKQNEVLPPVDPGGRHIPIVLLADKSGSMYGKPIEEINRILAEIEQAFNEDASVLSCLDLCVISFDDSVHTEVGFRPAEKYHAPRLSAGGRTALNHAIEAGLDALAARKNEYKARGIPYYRPWLFVMTGGAAEDTSHESTAAGRLRREIGNKKVNYLPKVIGPNADIEKLQSFYPADAPARPVFTADAGSFKDVFEWTFRRAGLLLNAGMNPGEIVRLPPCNIHIDL